MIHHRNTLKTKILPKLPFTTIELLRLQFINPHLLTYNVRVAYHPPSSSKISGTTSNFYAELEQLFIEASVSVIPTVIVGYFNVHFDDHITSEPIRTLLESFNLTQHVHSPTHQTGHILDLVVCHTDDNFITSVAVHPDSLSDHHRIELTLSALKPAVKTVMIAKRNFRNIETDDIVCGRECSTSRGIGGDVQHLSHCLDKQTPWCNVRVRDTFTLRLLWEITRLDYIVSARADAANSNRWPIIEYNYSDGECPARLCPWTTALFTLRPAYWRHYSSPWTILSPLSYRPTHTST